jgi:tRNA(Arg) A34 adenosine deaminase TadA
MHQWLALFIVFCAILLYVTHTRLHRLRGTVVLTEEQRTRLLDLAEISLQSSDVPIGALLLYQGKIIGEGYNTVLRNRKAGEHAEVNAISGAVAAMGMDKFSSLDRRELVLISTFEPCLMCGGAFVNYNIQNVFFMKEKDFSYTGKEEVLFVQYLLRRRQVKNNCEQDLLFEKHPGYPDGKK